MNRIRARVLAVFLFCCVLNVKVLDGGTLHSIYFYVFWVALLSEVSKVSKVKGWME